MSDKHIGEVVQVTGPVLDIQFAHDELPALLNAITIDLNGSVLVAEVAQAEAVAPGSRDRIAANSQAHSIIHGSLPLDPTAR